MSTLGRVWLHEDIEPGLTWQYVVKKELGSAKSEFQDVVLVDTVPFGKALLIDGLMQATIPSCSRSAQPLADDCPVTYDLRSPRTLTRFRITSAWFTRRYSLTRTRRRSSSAAEEKVEPRASFCATNR